MPLELPPVFPGTLASQPVPQHTLQYPSSDMLPATLSPQPAQQHTGQQSPVGQAPFEGLCQGVQDTIPITHQRNLESSSVAQYLATLDAESGGCLGTLDELNGGNQLP